MSALGPVQVPSNFTNVKTFPDLVRYVSSFTSNLARQFNELVSRRDVVDARFASAIVNSDGSATYLFGIQGATLLSAGRYRVFFESDFSAPPAVTPGLGANAITGPYATWTGVTLTQVDVSVFTSAGVATSCTFSLSVQGKR